MAFLKKLLLSVVATVMIGLSPLAHAEVSASSVYTRSRDKQQANESLNQYRERVNREYYAWSAANKALSLPPREIRKMVDQGKKIYLFPSRPVIVADETRKDYPALLIEVGQALWIYSLERGTLQLTSTGKELAAALENPGPALEEHGIRLVKSYPKTATFRKRSFSSADEDNDCFIQSLTRYVELKRMGVPLKEAAVYCFWYEHGEEKFGHAVLVAKDGEGHNYYHDILFNATIQLRSDGGLVDQATSPDILCEIVQMRATRPDITVPEGSIVSIYKTVPLGGPLLGDESLTAYRLDTPAVVTFTKGKLASLGMGL